MVTALLFAQFFATKSVGVSSDASTFCFPQGSTPERKQNENIK